MTSSSQDHSASAVLDITGMSCDHCVARVGKAIAAVGGVGASDVSIGSARVNFDPTLVSAEEIAASVTRVGYPARVANADS